MTDMSECPGHSMYQQPGMAETMRTLRLPGYHAKFLRATLNRSQR